MERVELAGGVSLSRLVYGMWRLGEDVDTSAGHIRAKVEACLDQGITTMDHADIYGGYRAEQMFGDALRGSGLLNRVEIVTKCGIVVPEGDYAAARLKHYNTSAAHIHASVDRSLRLLGADQIDLLLIHRPDPFMDYAQTGAALDAVVASGKVRAVGVSNFRPWDMAALQAGMTNRLATNQIELSLSALEPFTNGDLASLMEKGLPPMAWSPLGGGSLMTAGGAVAAVLDRIAAEQGADRGAVAVAWLLAHPARILPVMGTNALPRIKTLARACEVTLSRVEWFELNQAGLGREVA